MAQWLKVWVLLSKSLDFILILSDCSIRVYLTFTWFLLYNSVTYQTCARMLLHKSACAQCSYMGLAGTVTESVSIQLVNTFFV